MAKNKNIISTEESLFIELSQLIEQSQQQFVLQANSALTMLFWNIGKRINESILNNKRGDYGKQIVVTLSRQLADRYRRNFEEKNLRRMLQFAEQFPDKEIVVTLSRQLSWSHILVLLPLKNSDAKLFYAKSVSAQGLGVRELRKVIAAKEFERTSIANLQISSNNPGIYNNFKDPYFLDFLGLQNTYLEKDLEEAIRRDIKGRKNPTNIAEGKKVTNASDMGDDDQVENLGADAGRGKLNSYMKN